MLFLLLKNFFIGTNDMLLVPKMNDTVEVKIFKFRIGSWWISVTPHNVNMNMQSVLKMQSKCYPHYWEIVENQIIDCLLQPIIVPQSCCPIGNYKRDSNDWLDLSWEHDTAREDPPLVVGSDHDVVIVVLQCIVLDSLIYVNQVSVISFLQWRNVFNRCGSLIWFISVLITSLHSSYFSMMIYLPLIL